MKKSLVLKFIHRTKWFLVSGIVSASFLNCFAQDGAVIDLDVTHQIIRGFGAANILPWRPDMTADEIQKAFGTDDGQLGFSILRLRLPSSENQFSSNITTAKAAYEMGVTLMASPWSPPANMKTNSNTTGGELRESKYSDFAEYINTFVDYMADNDAPLYGVSVQNEPDINVSYESCDYTPAQMLKFVKEQGDKIKTRLMAPESYRFNKSMSDPILNDSVACANTDIICGHIYGGGRSPYPLAEQKGKELWMTEYLINSNHIGANMDTSWTAAMETVKSMHDCMKSNMSAYIWWYIIRYYGPICDGTYLTKGEVTPKGYAMSQYSRFIRPGYYRVECDPYPQTSVYLTAYKDEASSKYVIVIINRSSLPKEQTFTLQNGNTETFTSFVTSQQKRCQEDSHYTVVNGSFTATLDGSSITTFVADASPVSVENITPSTQSFQLCQNYPNPFNPNTEIRYQTSEDGPVRLTIYDVLGKEVGVLVNEVQSSGVYSVSFTPEQFGQKSSTSGVYFYTLKLSNERVTKKMLYLR